MDAASLDDAISLTGTTVHVTDIEGNWSYWNAYIRISEGLYRDKDGVPALRDNCEFVFGGDSFDKGPGDIRFGRELVKLKQRYPDRVFLIIGNRDLNKTKLTAELDPVEIAHSPVEAAQFPFWTEASVRVTAKQYIDALVAADKDAAALSPAEALAKQNTPLNRLKFMLRHTMGCETTFELRRQELAILGETTPSEISDEAVLASYVDGLLKPDGFIRNYLESAQLGAVLGDTLFVHGAVSPLSAGFVPADDTRDAIHEVKGTEMKDTHSVQEWIAALNAWAAKHVDAWKRAPFWLDVPRPGAAGDGAAAAEVKADAGACDSKGKGSEPYRRRGGQPLMAFGYMPAMKVLAPSRALSLKCVHRTQGRTVIVSTFFDAKTGAPTPPDASVARYLNRSGVHRVIVGHKPFGDSPTVIDQPGLEVVSADQSYADPRAKDNRGAAVSETFVRRYRTTAPVCGCERGVEFSSTRIHGTTHDGAAFAYCLPPLFTADALAAGRAGTGAGAAPGAGGSLPSGVVAPSPALREAAHKWLRADPFVGKQLPATASGGSLGGWWVKLHRELTAEERKALAIATAGDAAGELERKSGHTTAHAGSSSSKERPAWFGCEYLLSRGTGRKVEYRWVAASAPDWRPTAKADAAVAGTGVGHGAGAGAGVASSL